MEPSAGQAELREKLVQDLKREKYIRSRLVEHAFRATPRHVFLPSVSLEIAYSDTSLTTKRIGRVGISAASQPSAVATMLEQLQLEPGQNVLEIGAGTGYNAALIGHIVGRSGQVISLDIDDELVVGANDRLRELDLPNVRAISADGANGLPAEAPYDRVVLTVGAWDVVPAWIDQLKPNGILLLPLDLHGVQKTIAFRKARNCLESISISHCSFMELRGSFVSPVKATAIWPDFFVQGTQPLPVDAEPLRSWFTSSGRDTVTEVSVTPQELWEDLNLWLALRNGNFCNVVCFGRERQNVPTLFDWTSIRSAIGLISSDGVALLTAAHSSRGLKAAARMPEFRIRSYGADGAPTRQLASEMDAWHYFGRVRASELRIVVLPLDGNASSDEGVNIRKRWHRVIVEEPRLRLTLAGRGADPD